MRIRVVVPITGLSDEQLEERMRYLRSLAEDGTVIDAARAERGPPAIESEADAVEAGPEILRMVREAEREGYDAAIIWCAGDPALRAARELVDIPVIGPGEAMRVLSSMMGARPCRITPDIPVLEMRRNLDETVRVIRGMIEERIRRGEGDCFYLGCLALWGLGKRLREEFGLPVIDGAEASLKLAETAVKLGLRHSRLAYPRHGR